MAKKYLLYIHEELFENEKTKSRLVNNLLERHYHDTVQGKSQETIIKDIKRMQDLVSIPGVERASEAVCKGTHYMSRENCGKPRCPWA